MSFFNAMMRWFLQRREEQIERFRHYPVEVQYELFHELIDKARLTEWGQAFNYGSIKTYKDFRNRFPVQDYETLKPWIQRVMEGEQNLLWPGKVNWFAKSSGTTSDKSKFIPVTREALDECHFKAGKDVMAVYCANYPDTKVFSGKSLVVGGSSKVSTLNKQAQYGDVSAVMLKNLPYIAEFFRTPDISIALMDEWESKIEQMAQSTIKEDVTYIAGVPSWTMLLIRRILDVTGKDNLKEVWPNLELFIHGGVSFKPYRNQYQQVLPNSGMRYMETYNASEGFLAMQDDPKTDDMLLMLDYGIFYEFIPFEDIHSDNPRTILLDEVELDKQYAVVISTNGGLWRYKIGDTVRFTSKYPFKIQISGRIKHFINAFGEEVVIDNADKALAIACAKTASTVKEYTAAPVFLDKGRGYHRWLIEFERAPSNLNDFRSELDNALQHLNSDYEAKRYKDMILEPLRIQVMPAGTFYFWLKSKGQLGGQHKVPRLSNDDEILHEIMGVAKASVL